MTEVLSAYSSLSIGAAFCPMSGAFPQERGYQPVSSLVESGSSICAEHHMAEEVVTENSGKPPKAEGEDGKPSLSADDRRAREAVRALADLGALKRCMSCGRDSDRILQPVIYGEDLLNRAPILPLVCADCGHITYYGVDQILSAATKRKAHG
jgi:hypothetical protein